MSDQNNGVLSAETPPSKVKSEKFQRTIGNNLHPPPPKLQQATHVAAMSTGSCSYTEHVTFANENIPNIGHFLQTHLYLLREVS